VVRQRGRDHGLKTIDHIEGGRSTVLQGTNSRIVGLTLAERTAGLTHDTWGVIGGDVIAPYCVEIQPTAHCHRTCSFCSHIIRNRRGGTISEEEVRGLLADFRAMGVHRVAFSGGGEPLYWSGGRLAEMIEIAAEFSEVSLTTSGDQLWLDDRQELHPDASVLLERCMTMYFNIPAVDELNFAKQVRGPSGWSHSSKMLRNLVVLRDSDPGRYRCQLHAVVVVSVFNVDQIATIDRVLFEHGVDAIYYKQWKNFEKRNVKRVKLEDEYIVDRLGAIPEAERSADLTAFIEGVKVEFPAHRHCWSNRLAYNAIVDPDGEIYMCTPTVGKPEFSIGNLDDGGFAAVWTSAVRDAKLRELSQMSYDGLCPRECRHHPDNVRLTNVLAGR
jgi:radical SAM protein with 4Fe4S-binding SPASM domain